MTLHDDQQAQEHTDQALPHRRPETPDDRKRQPPRTAWKKGQSGNPRGRKPIAAHRKEFDIQALAKSETKAAMRCLIDVMKDKSAPAAARVGAADKVLERGWGKAAVKVDVTHSLEDFFADVVRGLDRAIETDYSVINDLPAPEPEDDTHSQD